MDGWMNEARDQHKAWVTSQSAQRPSGSCPNPIPAPPSSQDALTTGNVLCLASLSAALHVRFGGNARSLWEQERLLVSLALGKIKPALHRGARIAGLQGGPGPPSLHLFTRHLSLGSGEPGGWIRWVSALIDSDTSSRAPACPHRSRCSSPASLRPHPVPEGGRCLLISLPGNDFPGCEIPI